MYNFLISSEYSLTESKTWLNDNPHYTLYYFSGSNSRIQGHSKLLTYLLESLWLPMSSCYTSHGSYITFYGISYMKKIDVNLPIAAGISIGKLQLTQISNRIDVEYPFFTFFGGGIIKVKFLKLPMVKHRKYKILSSGYFILNGICKFGGIFGINTMHNMKFTTLFFNNFGLYLSIQIKYSFIAYNPGIFIYGNLSEIIKMFQNLSFSHFTKLTTDKAIQICFTSGLSLSGYSKDLFLFMKHVNEQLSLIN